MVISEGTPSSTPSFELIRRGKGPAGRGGEVGDASRTWPVGEERQEQDLTVPYLLELICTSLRQVSRQYELLDKKNLQLEVRAVSAEESLGVVRTEAASLRRRAERARERAAASETEVVTLRAEVQALREELDAAKASADASRAEAEAAQREKEAVELAKVEELKLLEKGRVATQGPIFRAFAERLLFSESFFELLGRLSGLAMAKIAVKVLDRVASDYPDLHRAKYGYEAMEGEEFNRAYAQILLEGLESFPVLDTLAKSNVLLTAEMFFSCPIDQDEDLVTVIAALREEAAKAAEDESAGGEEEERETEVEAEADIEADVEANAGAVVEPEAGLRSSATPNIGPEGV